MVDEPGLVKILQARMINHALGGAVVGPGDIDGLQDDFIEACRMIVIEAPQMAEKMRPKGKRRGK